MTKPLTPKQDRFCREYVKDFNATRAYIAAGYSKNGAKTSGPRMLSRACIQARVKELNDKVNAAADFDAKWIREQMRDLHNHAHSKQNSEDIQALGYAQLRGKQIENMARVEGMFSDKLELDGRSQITYNITTGRKPKK